MPPEVQIAAIVCGSMLAAVVTLIIAVTVNSHLDRVDWRKRDEKKAAYLATGGDPDKVFS